MKCGEESAGLQAVMFAMSPRRILHLYILLLLLLLFLLLLLILFILLLLFHNSSVLLLVSVPLEPCNRRCKLVECFDLINLRRPIQYASITIDVASNTIDPPLCNHFFA